MASRKVNSLISLQKAKVRKLFARVCCKSVTLSVLLHAIRTVQTELKINSTSQQHATNVAIERTTTSYRTECCLVIFRVGNDHRKADYKAESFLINHFERACSSRNIGHGRFG